MKQAFTWDNVDPDLGYSELKQNTQTTYNI